MASSAWHPCDDGIKPIIEAIEEFVGTTPEAARAATDDPYTRLGSNIGDACSAPPSPGTAGRKEFVADWLRLNLNDDVACDFNLQLDVLLRHVSRWNNFVPAAWELAPDDVYPPAWRGLMEVEDRALQVADYLRRLEWMIRGKLRKSVRGDIHKRTPAGLAEELDISEATVGRWREAVGIRARSGSDVMFTDAETVKLLTYGANNVRRRTTKQRCRDLLGLS